MSARPDPGRGPGARSGRGAAVPRSLEELRATVASMLEEHADAIDLDDDLVLDWGLDSMRVMDFVERLRASGLQITILELAEHPTIRAWDTLLAARARTPPPS